MDDRSFPLGIGVIWNRIKSARTPRGAARFSRQFLGELDCTELLANKLSTLVKLTRTPTQGGKAIRLIRKPKAQFRRPENCDDQDEVNHNQCPQKPMNAFRISPP